MNVTLKIPVRQTRDWTTLALVTGYLAVGATLLLRNYLLVDGIFLLSCLLAPYLFIVRRPGVYSVRYAFPVGLFCLLWWVAPVKTFQYLTFAFALLMLLEARLGRLNVLPVILLGVLSPVSRYLTDVFGFPIRLQLSQWAGQLLRATGQAVEVQGNVLVLAGHEFTVDPACVGLQLTHVSCLLALFLLAHFERQTGKWLRNRITFLALAITAVLVVVANLIRIVLLVQFNIHPNQVSHDLVGLICLLVYVVLPTAVLYQWVYRQWGKVGFPVQTVRARPAFSSVIPLVVPIIFLAPLFYGQSNPVNQIPASVLQLPGYQRVVLPGGITKFENKYALVYAKPIQAFYSTEHSPLICWRGSGYQFKQINQQQIAGRKVYVGKLEKAGSVLYTAWWFDNGDYQTFSQWEWRWRMLRGQAAFRLVNVSAASEETLHRETARLLREGFTDSVRQKRSF